MNRLSLTLVAGSLLAGGLASAQSLAQPAWPSKTLRFIVPFPPGGGNDTVARADTKKARECSESIGSSICRRDDSGVKAPSNVISGDDLRRSGTILPSPEGEPPPRPLLAAAVTRLANTLLRLPGSQPISAPAPAAPPVPAPTPTDPYARWIAANEPKLRDRQISCEAKPMAGSRSRRIG